MLFLIMDSFYAGLTGGINAIRKLTGIPVMWKSLATHSTDLYNAATCTHRTPYCMEIKSDPEKMARCRFDDNIVLILESLENREPYLRPCHGGVVDYLVPVMDGHCYLGCFFCGPWRTGDSVCPYSENQAAYRSVPIHDPALCRDIYRLLLPYCEYIVAHTAVPRLSGDLSQRQTARMHLAVNEIRNRLHQPLRAGSVAALCALSESRFLHLFQEATGIGFSAFVAKARISRAKQLLRNTRLTMSAIAEKCGFSSQSYFNQAFRRYTGYSPGQYRRL